MATGESTVKRNKPCLRDVLQKLESLLRAKPQLVSIGKDYNYLLFRVEKRLFNLYYAAGYLHCYRYAEEHIPGARVAAICGENSEDVDVIARKVAWLLESWE